MMLGDRSLITWKGATKLEGRGQFKFYPYEKGGGGGKSSSHAEGNTKCFKVVLMQDI